MLEQFGVTALVLIVGALGFMLRGFFTSYGSEKGKNLATKQDVEQITSQVESVRASVQTLATLRTDYQQQRRECLLSFYDSAVEMLYEKLSANFGEMPGDGGKTLFEFQQSFGGLVVALLKQYQRIVVYFEPGSSLRESSEAIVDQAVKAHGVLRKRFARVKVTLMAECEAHDSGDRDSYHLAVGESDQAAEAYWNDMNPVVEAYRESLQVYLSHLNIFLSASGSNKRIADRPEGRISRQA